MVTVERDAIPALLPWLNECPTSGAWRDYVSDVSTSPQGLVRLFHELALTVSQFGGFIGYREDGTLRVWKRDGSGVKAILHVIEAIRRDRLRPGIDTPARVDARLAAYLIGAPFAAERLAMMAELAHERAQECFEKLLRSARRDDGSYVFNVLHMMTLRTAFPRCFGGDGAFSKKASLLLMTLEIALKDLGFDAKAYTVPPADYRIPQILQGLGVLRFHDELARDIERGRVFHARDRQVHAIRAATVEAVTEISKNLVVHDRSPLTTAELDSRLYLLSRNQALMTTRAMKPHMLVATLSF